jgi:hypothetical protein
MKKIICVMIIGLFLGAPSLAYCESNKPWTGNARLLLGGKYYDKDDWTGRSSQYQLGGLFDFGMKEWPVNLALDILYSSGKINAVKAGVFEESIGVRKYFGDDPKLQTYLGGGGTLARAILDSALRNPGDDETGYGIWLNLGFSYLLTDRVTIGGDLRYSTAKVSIFNTTDVRAGGMHAGFTLGWKF